MSEAEQILNKAADFFDQKKYLHAIQMYNLLQNFPEYRRTAIARLIEIYEIQNQFSAADKLFELYIQENEEDDDFRTYYAHFLIRNEKYNDAHNILAGVSKDKHPEKNFLMGMVNYYLSDYEIAVINFEEFIRTNKKSELLPEAYLYLSKSHLKQYQLDSALKNAKQSEKLFSGNYELYLTFAITYYLKEMYFHAFDNIQKSIKLNPTDAALFEWGGKIAFKMGEFEKAEQFFKDCISIEEPDSEIYSLLGMTCLNNNKIDEAKNYFDLALKLNPEDELALRGKNDTKISSAN